MLVQDIQWNVQNHFWIAQNREDMIQKILANKDVLLEKELMMINHADSFANLRQITLSLKPKKSSTISRKIVHMNAKTHLNLTNHVQRPMWTAGYLVAMTPKILASKHVRIKKAKTKLVDVNRSVICRCLRLNSVLIQTRQNGGTIAKLNVRVLKEDVTTNAES